MKKLIEKSVCEAVEVLQNSKEGDNFAVPKIIVERPKDVPYGGWTTNVAFMLAKDLKKASFSVAEEIASVMNEKRMRILQKLQ